MGLSFIYFTHKVNDYGVFQACLQTKPNTYFVKNFSENRFLVRVGIRL